MTQPGSHRQRILHHWNVRCWVILAARVSRDPPSLPRGRASRPGLVSTLNRRRLKYAVSTQGEAIDLQQVFLQRTVFELSVVRSLAALLLLLCFRGTLWSRLAGFHGDRSRREEVRGAWGRLLGDGGDGGGRMLGFRLLI